jgi:hypothetical protein
MESSITQSLPSFKSIGLEEWIGKAPLSFTQSNNTFAPASQEILCKEPDDDNDFAVFVGARADS